MNTIPTTGQKIKIPAYLEGMIFEVKQIRNTATGYLYHNGLYFGCYVEQDIEKFELVTE